jgi:hypothetical protein
MEDTASGGNTGGSADVATFASADWSAPVDSPSTETAIETTTSPATAQPGSESAAPTPQETERSPYVDRQRFDTVNDRMKAAEEWRQQNAWVENPAAREAIERIARHQGDPLGMLAELVNDLGPHPEYGPKLRSFLGQQFGGLRQRTQPTAPEAPTPDVAIRDEHGNVVGQTYSAEALAKRDAFLEQQLLAKIEQTYAPKLKTLETIQQEREHAAAQQQAQSFAKTFEQQAVEMIPEFDIKTHGPAVAAELAKLNLQPNAHPSVVEAAGLRALMKVMLPNLGNAAQSRLMGQLQTKAAASMTGVNPASAAPTSTGNIGSFSDARLTW